MSETLRDRNASMPDCTLSGARTKKAVETAVHVDRGRSTITLENPAGLRTVPTASTTNQLKQIRGNEKTETHRLSTPVIAPSDHHQLAS